MQNLLQWRQPIEFLESPRFSVSGDSGLVAPRCTCAGSRSAARVEHDEPMVKHFENPTYSAFTVREVLDVGDLRD